MLLLTHYFIILFILFHPSYLKPDVHGINGLTCIQQDSLVLSKYSSGGSVGLSIGPRAGEVESKLPATIT